MFENISDKAKSAMPSIKRCELCGMLAVTEIKDEYGLTHAYCEHHIPHKKTNVSVSEECAHAKDATHDKHAGHSPNMFRDRFWLSLVLTLPIILYSHSIQEWFNFRMSTFVGSEWLPLIFGTIVFFYGGLVFIKSALTEIKAKLPGMMTLISLAIIAAYVYSVTTTFLIQGSEFFWELGTLITIMLFGHWMEMKSVQSAQGALRELAKLLPDEAELVEGSDTRRIALNILKINDIVLVRPGGKVPIDGEVIEGGSSLNESMITGESKPVNKGIGSQVIAGTINGTGSLKVKITKIGENTLLAGVMRLVAEAQASQSKTQILADKAAFYLTIVALLAGFSAFGGWLIAGADPTYALERMVAVLVIACPHALGLAVPLVTAISTSKAARSGLLIRQRIALESARNINVILFDKTGTLTTGEQGIVTIWSSNTAYSQKYILALAAAVEADSEHAIGQAIRKAAREKKISIPQASNFTSISGQGVQATVAGKKIIIGGPQLLKMKNIQLSERLRQISAEIGQQGKAIIYVIEESTIIGGFSIADIIRPESRGVIQELKQLGIKTAMVTGDSQDVAQAVAKELGISEYFAEVLPVHKVDKVKDLQKDGSRVAMVGDGVNDAPALAQANIGIAIGAGTDVAIESAGIILIKNNPQDIVKIIKLSKSTYRKMIQNLIWATGYNVVAIPLAAGALASFGIILAPAVGAVLMSFSTIIVAFNAQLLKRLKI